MFESTTLPGKETFRVQDIDTQTMRFLETLPRVTVTPRPHDAYDITIPAGVEKKLVGSDPGENDTWLYRFPTGQVLGRGTEGMMMSASVWPTSENVWQASNAYEFAMACYAENIAAGLIPAGTPPPEKATFTNDEA